MNLSPNFSLSELVNSQTAVRKGIDNTPTPEVVANLKDLAVNVLQPVREHFGKPVVISSGYRSPKLNAAVGGAKNSDHMTGCAADIEIPGVPNKVVAEWIAKNLKFSQLILEGAKANDPSAGWVHVSYKKAALTGTTMSAAFVNGKAIYSGSLTSNV